MDCERAVVIVGGLKIAARNDQHGIPRTAPRHTHRDRRAIRLTAGPRKRGPQTRIGGESPPKDVEF